MEQRTASITVHVPLAQLHRLHEVLNQALFAAKVYEFTPDIHIHIVERAASEGRAKKYSGSGGLDNVQMSKGLAAQGPLERSEKRQKTCRTGSSSSALSYATPSRQTSPCNAHDTEEDAEIDDIKKSDFLHQREAVITALTTIKTSTDGFLTCYIRHTNALLGVKTDSAPDGLDGKAGLLGSTKVHQAAAED